MFILFYFNKIYFKIIDKELKNILFLLKNFKNKKNK